VRFSRRLEETVGFGLEPHRNLTEKRRKPHEKEKKRVE